MNAIQPCRKKSDHEWNKTYGDFAEEATLWHEQCSAPQTNYYLSDRVVHYWDEAICKRCGARLLLSVVYDRKDAQPISDENFLWLSIFINQLNEEIGSSDQKRVLINYALDQLPWNYYPHVRLADPDNNMFEISFKDNMYTDFDWDYFGAYLLFRTMNVHAMQYLPPEQVREIEGPFTEFEQLKAKYRTLMEIATQSGYSPEVKQEMNQLYIMLEKLSEVLKRFT